MIALPSLIVKLDEQDLRTIRDRSLFLLKHTQNRALEAEVFTMYCVLKAFTELVNKTHNHLQLIQPERSSLDSGASDMD